MHSSKRILFIIINRRDAAEDNECYNILYMKAVIKHARRVIITIVGITVILIALALFVLPGPGILVLLIGLGILATEYKFARDWLETLKKKYEDGKDLVTGKGSKGKKK